MDNLGTLIFAVVTVPFLVIALIFIAVMIRSRSKVRYSQKNWATANGHVQTAYVEPRESHDEHGTHTSYYPVVLYEYVAKGQRYQSNRVRFGMEVGYGWTQPAQKTVDKYPAGSIVPVRYDPANPADAVLEESLGGSNRVLGCVVAVMLGILLITGAAMLFMQGIFSQVTNLVPGS